MKGSKAWLAAALLPLAAPAAAQSVNDFRLQPASSASPERPQGPTDRDAPVVRPAAPASGAATAPSASATPTARATTPAPKPKPSPSPSATPSAKPATKPSPSPTAEETASKEPSETPSPPAVVTSEPAPDPTHTHVATPMPEGADGSGAAWWWALIPIAVLVLGASWIAARRRGDEEADASEEPEDEAITSELIAHWGGQPAPAPPVLPEPAFVSDPEPPPPPSANPALSLALEPVRMMATIVSSLFTYRLTVTNPAETPVGPVHIAGSLIGAHASLPVEQQLGNDGQILELLHEIPGLEPGESCIVQGDLRLPLNLIDPIHAGEALLFVPIARFRAEGADNATLAAFVLGEAPQVPGGALVPFRLDLGPRVWPQVDSHRLDIPPSA